MKILDYINDTRGEMKHVSWPTRSQAVNYTILVVVISLVTSFYLGLLDFILAKILKVLI